MTTPFKTVTTVAKVERLIQVSINQIIEDMIGPYIPEFYDSMANYERHVNIGKKAIADLIRAVGEELIAGTDYYQEARLDIKQDQRQKLEDIISQIQK